VPISIRTHTGWAPCRLARLAASCVALTLASSAAAQTRFAWPDTTVDLSKYTAVDQCIAAVRRIRDGQLALGSQVVWRDTMPADEQEHLKPLPAPVIQAATRCASRFDQRTAKLTDFVELMELYLVADRDADAKALLDRRLTAITAKGAREHNAVEDSAVLIYLTALPRRLDAAERMLVGRAHGGGSDRLDRMALYDRLMQAAREAGDTSRSRRVAKWTVALADSLTQDERESDKFAKMGAEGGNLVVFSAMFELVGSKALADSLRHSTLAMVNLMRTMWSKYTKERPEALPFPLGEHAPTITGDFWYPREASGGKHPAPGHVSIVEFVDASRLYGSCMNDQTWNTISDACTANWYSLRRLGDRFPGLDITLVLGTRGNFLHVPPPSAAEEAELYHNWIDPYHIKGAVLSATARPFWNLPEPDGRRVDKPDPNSVAYSFGKSWNSAQGSGAGGRYLVDQDGLIVDVFFNETATIQFIDALMHRQKAGGDRAEK
jgi:hypothetical protein